jgi:hypothetical protein
MTVSTLRKQEKISNRVSRTYFTTDKVAVAYIFFCTVNTEHSEAAKLGSSKVIFISINYC